MNLEALPNHPSTYNVLDQYVLFALEVLRQDTQYRGDMSRKFIATYRGEQDNGLEVAQWVVRYWRGDYE